MKSEATPSQRASLQGAPQAYLPCDNFVATEKVEAGLKPRCGQVAPEVDISLGSIVLLDPASEALMTVGQQRIVAPRLQAEYTLIINTESSGEGR